MNRAVLNKYRNELGKLHRKEYEGGYATNGATVPVCAPTSAVPTANAEQS